VVISPFLANLECGMPSKTTKRKHTENSKNKSHLDAGNGEDENELQNRQATAKNAHACSAIKVFGQQSFV